MKTLDEVIFEAPYSRTPWEADALHYLKEYQSVKAVLEFKKRQYEEMAEAILKQGQEREAFCQAEITRYQEAVKNCEAAENKYRQLSEELGKTSAELGNEPLTWEELQEMGGKPLWLEWTKTEESYWCFVGEWFDDDEMRIYHIGRDYADYIHKTIYTPDIVQAYRKEKE